MAFRQGRDAPAGDRRPEVQVLPEPVTRHARQVARPAGPPGFPYSVAMPAGPPTPTAPVTSVAEAIARMEAIGAGLPASDGLACFNRMYLAVTQAGGTATGQGFYADPAFTTPLDVTVANLYFAAAQAAPALPRPPRWPAACC